MRKPVFFLIIIFSISCSGKLQESIAETYPDGSLKKVHYFTTEAGNRFLAKEIHYYQNGLKKMEGFFNAEGKKHGKWVYWREDGKKWSEGYFFEGKDDKIRTTWHENGKKHYVGKYDKGTRVGNWKFYDESGKMVKEIDYDQKNQ